MFCSGKTEQLEKLFNTFTIIHLSKEQDKLLAKDLCNKKITFSYIFLSDFMPIINILITTHALLYLNYIISSNICVKNNKKKKQ